MVYGTLVAYGNPKVGDPGSHFGSPLNEFPFTETLVYIGFTALLLNLLVTVGRSTAGPARRWCRRGARRDETSPDGLRRRPR